MSAGEWILYALIATIAICVGALIASLMFDYIAEHFE
jgi:hypothetical protein